MASTVKAAFGEFASRLEPTEAQRSDASTKHNGVRDCLNTVLWVQTAFLTGSYGRYTIIRPLTDIDLFVVLDYTKHGQDYHMASGSVDKVLSKFHSTLKICYPYTPIRKDHPAIYLDFSTYGFDVTPAFPRNGGGYIIPNRLGSGWMSTDPTRHAAQTTTLNKATSGFFIPMVKMFKAWNRAHYNKLTGFHLEMALADAWPKPKSALYPYVPTPTKYSDYAQAVAALLPVLSAKLGYYTSDPAGMSGNVDHYLEYADRKLTIERLNGAAIDAQVALRHEIRENHSLAITKWRDIFGESFPAYSYY